MRRDGDAALHPAGDGDELAGDMSRQALGREDDDLRGDVLRGRDLAKRHCPRDPAHVVVLEHPRVMGDTVQPGATALDADTRAEAGDLVLQGEQQPSLDRSLRRSVVGVAGLTESSGRGADEDERASLALRLDEPAEERARGEKRGCQVERDRPLEAREVELLWGSGRVDACDGGAPRPCRGPRARLRRAGPPRPRRSGRPGRAARRRARRPARGRALAPR